MILYHGSNIDIQDIDLSKSRVNKDFGQGFYLTADKQQAIRLAEQRVRQDGGEVVVNAYEFDETILKDSSLKVKIFEGYTEEWASFVNANRDTSTLKRIHDYDIVVGAIANDTVGLQLFRYKRNIISLHKLVEELKYKRLTIQYYFGTERAIKHLRKL